MIATGTSNYADLANPNGTEPPEDDDDLVPESFHPIDLGEVLDGNVVQPEPTILRRDDGMALFYPGQVNGIHGDSGTGKGWVVLLGVAQQIKAGRNVIILDLEDVPASIVSRLRLLGATDAEIRDHVTYVRPTDPFGIWAVDHLEVLVIERNASLIVIDSLGEAFGLDGVDENSDADAGPWLRRVARRLADAGPAVVLVDHSTKANDNPLHPSGSKRKRAAVGGASYLVTAKKPLAADTGGRLALTCAKDRHGTYARGDVVAELVMKPTPLGSMKVDLYAPSASKSETLPVELAARAAVATVRNSDVTLNVRTLLGLMPIKVGRDTKVAGIELAIARGAIAETPGDRKQRLLTYVTDLEGEPE